MPTEQFWLMVAQIAATALLGASAILVATVSAVITYRNNFGWKPSVLVASHGVGIVPEHDELTVSIDIEVWNRRKYAINVYTIDLTFIIIGDDGQVEPVDTTIPRPVRMRPEDTPIHRSKGGIRVTPMRSLAFNENLTLGVSLQHRSHQHPKYADLELRYFDPRLSKTITSKTKCALSFRPWF